MQINTNSLAATSYTAKTQKITNATATATESSDNTVEKSKFDTVTISEEGKKSLSIAQNSDMQTTSENQTEGTKGAGKPPKPAKPPKTEGTSQTSETSVLDSLEETEESEETSSEIILSNLTESEMNELISSGDITSTQMEEELESRGIKS